MKYWPRDPGQPNRSVSGDLVLVPRHEATVTFEASGGTLNGPGSVTVFEGETIAPPADPSPPASGDLFDGWFVDEARTTPYDFGEPVTAHLTLYAGYSAPYAVGDTGPAGGVVFYVAPDDSAGWRFLEAAPADLAGTYQWGLWGTTGDIETRDDWWFTSGADNSLGGGASSTAAMLDKIDTSADDYGGNTAAEVAAAYALGGVSDWYLPSVQELLELEALWTTLGMVDDASALSRYWSSTSYPAPGYSVGQMEGRAFTVGRNPSTGALTLEPPDFVSQRIGERLVRPIRRF